MAVTFIGSTSVDSAWGFDVSMPGGEGDSGDVTAPSAFTPPSGSDRLLVNASSMSLSMSFDGVAMTTLYDFTVDATSNYHNLLHVSYMKESDLPSSGTATFALTWTNSPVSGGNIFDDPMLHWGFFSGVDQTTPVTGTEGTNTATDVTAQVLTAGTGLGQATDDQLMTFFVIGQSGDTRDITSPSGWTENSEFVTPTSQSNNGHGSAVTSRTSQGSSLSQNPQLEQGGSDTRLAIGLFRLNVAAAAPAGPPLGTHSLLGVGR